MSAHDPKGTARSLIQKLQSMPAGTIAEPEAEEVRVLLEEAWSSLDGAFVQGMRPDKILRAEGLEWDPPCLSFRLERHGRTAMGSTRADIQSWKVDLDTFQTACSSSGYRQVHSQDKRMDVKALAVRVARDISAHRKRKYLTWKSDDRVRIIISLVIPQTYVQTTQGRRRRFRNHLESELLKVGWTPADGSALYTYCRAQPLG